MAKRRRKRAAQVVAARTLIEIKQKRLAFLREVGALLSDALGFEVKVSLVKRNRMEGLSPTERRFARMSRKDLDKQVREAFAPLEPREEPE